MARLRKILLALLLLLLLGVLLAGGGFYWRARHALPQYDGEVRLTGLAQPVRILRDEHAVPHIYAQSLDDLLFAQGYVHAQERLWQMDLLRRTARGRLAEIFGPAALEMDKENRRLGLGSVADRAAQSLDPDSRRQLEAYTRGVNTFIESRRGSPLTSGLPVEFALLHYEPEPWQPADSLAVGLNMFKLLYTSWRSELARARVSERVGPELAADLFVARSEHDHPIAEPLATRPRPHRPRVFVARACRHRLEELWAEAPAPNFELLTASPVPRRLYSHWRQSAEADGARYGASNNWVVAGSHTASGAPLLADDMHLPHTVPSIWFINHLKSPEVDVEGFSLPGVPWVIVGHNQRLAWGFTNMMVDTQDLFIERFDPNDPSRYMTPLGWQPVVRRREHIVVRNAAPVDFEVLETRHGPIVHDDGPTKLALQWTALDPSQLSFPFFAMNQAQNWEEFTRALRGYGGPPQNIVYADVDGNIGYYGAGRVPVRRTGHGEVPMPGDSSQYDWIGSVPFEDMPHAFNPPDGVLATANNRIVSDDYPVYITDRWIEPARVDRIYQLLTEEKKFAPEDFLRIQGDIVSLPDRFLAEQLLAAGTTVTAHPLPRAQALEALQGWDGSMRADSAAPLLVTTTRSQLLEELLRPHLGDDWKSYSWFMETVFLENVLRQRPSRWLPQNYKSYDELLLATLDRAAEQLLRENKAPNLGRLRWGNQLRVRFAHPFADHLPLLRRWFSVGGLPQSGGRYTVKQTGRTFGPSERLVVDFADLDRTLMNITLGEAGHVASPHYKDQFAAWYEVRSFPAPFTDPAVRDAARHTLLLLPR